MNDALLVRGFERLGNLMRNHQRVVDRDWPAGDAVGQRLAVDQFQYQRPRPAGILDAVDRGDMRMVE
jgi:hypothetical protein